MSLEEIAEELIRITGGIVTDKNIAGVLHIFGGIRDGVNSNWEEFLTKETNEVILRDMIKCSKCNTKIVIERTRHDVRIAEE